MIERIIAILQQAEFDLTGREIAEILWLATHLQPSEPSPQSQVKLKSEPQQIDSTLDIPPSSLPQDVEPSAEIYLPSPTQTSPSIAQTPKGLNIKVPAAVALRNSLALGRAMRPLMRKVPSSTEMVLDEEATVSRIAEEEIWQPVVTPAPQRWLELALVIEKSSSTAIWQQTIIELQKLLKHHGAFRDVRTWELTINPTNIKDKIQVELFPQNGAGGYSTVAHSANVLIDPKGQRLILLVSDCNSLAWREGLIHPLLELWGRKGLVTILQLLPERLWQRTALAAETPVQISSLTPGAFNSQLTTQLWDADEIPSPNLKFKIPTPIITLEPEPLWRWSQVIVGCGNNQTPGIIFSHRDGDNDGDNDNDDNVETRYIASLQLTKFRATASPLARRLAGLMASAPVSISVVNLIQQTLLPQSRQVHVAEVFMSGLLEPIANNNLDYIEYEFIPGARELLRESVPVSKTTSVLDQISEYIAKRIGLSVQEFEARLLAPEIGDKDIEANIRPFAQLKAQVLRQLGGEFTRIAQQLEQIYSNTPGERGGVPISLQTFAFEVLTVNDRGKIIKRENKQAQYFTENLGNGVNLEMVSIPGGKFMMGSKDDEGYESERPQHEVTVSPFFMGKYLVTQAQWREIAALPKVERDLKSDPSHFKGDNLPIEKISWYDAVEFCARLSQKTNRKYRLPSEAEWEYACRAGTITPFHFGDTITGELANYNATYTFANEKKREYPKKSTLVGSFTPNAFGLYDMHGNIWEWCEDIWHSNYIEAPSDGKPWVSKSELDEDNDNHSRLLRGGSWNFNPDYCRCANRRRRLHPDSRYNDIGLRVVCVAAART